LLYNSANMHLLNIWIISNNVYNDQVDSFLHKQNKERKKSKKRNKQKQKKLTDRLLIILVHERSRHISSEKNNIKTKQIQAQV